MNNLNPNQLIELAECDEFVNQNEELVNTYLKAINTSNYTRNDTDDENIRYLQELMIESLQNFYNYLTNQKNPGFTFNQLITLNTSKFQEDNTNLVQQYYNTRHKIDTLEQQYHKTNLIGLVSPEYKSLINKIQTITLQLKNKLNSNNII